MAQHLRGKKSARLERLHALAFIRARISARMETQAQLSVKILLCLVCVAKLHTMAGCKNMNTRESDAIHGSIACKQRFCASSCRTSTHGICNVIQSLANICAYSPTQRASCCHSCTRKHRVYGICLLCAFSAANEILYAKGSPNQVSKQVCIIPKPCPHALRIKMCLSCEQAQHTTHARGNPRFFRCLWANISTSHKHARLQTLCV